MQQRCRKLAAHPLSKAQLACRRAQKLRKVQQFRHFLQVLPVSCIFNAINIAEQSKESITGTSHQS